MSAERPHYHGHRRRLRERFIRSGLAGLADYAVVELLLTLDAIRDWGERITEQTGTQWRYCRVNQVEFEGTKSMTFAQAAGAK